MRFLAFILSFLLMALSVLPCADEYFTTSSEKYKSELNKQHNEEESHNDACSPFCHCTCCAGFSINHIPASASLISVDMEFYSSYLPGNLINYSSPVWQPPKVG